MAFDNNTFETLIDTKVNNVGNTTTTNTATVGVDLDNVGNTDASTNNSGNLDVGIDGSFQDGSHNESWDIDDSGNEGSYNFELDVSDHSVNDNSINAGVREYNTGLGDLHLGGGAGGGGGDLWVDNHNTVVDQSANSNILANGGVFQVSANQAQVASGEGALAAGDNNDITQSLDTSTNIAAGGDVLIDSDKTVDVSIGSNNTTTVDVDVIDNSVDVDLDNVGNEYSATLDIDNSFNEETTDISVEEWNIDADVIWDSNLAAIVDDVDIDL